MKKRKVTLLEFEKLTADSRNCDIQGRLHFFSIGEVTKEKGDPKKVLELVDHAKQVISLTVLGETNVAKTKGLDCHGCYRIGGFKAYQKNGTLSFVSFPDTPFRLEAVQEEVLVRRPVLVCSAPTRLDSLLPLRPFRL